MKNKIEIFEYILRSVRGMFMSFAIVVLVSTFFILGKSDAIQNLSPAFILKLFAICFSVSFTQFFLCFIDFNSFLLATSAYFADMLVVVSLFCYWFGFFGSSLKSILVIFTISLMAFVCVLLFVYYHDYKEANAINEIIKKNKDLLV